MRTKRCGFQFAADFGFPSSRRASTARRTNTCTRRNATGTRDSLPLRNRWTEPRCARLPFAQPDQPRKHCRVDRSPTPSAPSNADYSTSALVRKGNVTAAHRLLVFPNLCLQKTNIRRTNLKQLSHALGGGWLATLAMHTQSSCSRRPDAAKNAIACLAIQRQTG